MPHTHVVICCVPHRNITILLQPTIVSSQHKKPCKREGTSVVFVRNSDENSRLSCATRREINPLQETVETTNALSTTLFNSRMSPSPRDWRVKSFTRREYSKEWYTLLPSRDIDFPHWVSADISQYCNACWFSSSNTTPVSSAVFCTTDFVSASIGNSQLTTLQRLVLFFIPEGLSSQNRMRTKASKKA